MLEANTPAKSDKTANGFTQIPNWILDDPRIKMRDKVVLGALFRCAYGKKSVVHPSQELLAQRLGTDRETVRKALAELVKSNLIEPLERGGKGRKVAYRLRLRPVKHGGATATTSKKTQEVGDGITAISGAKGGGITAIKNTDTEYKPKNTDAPALPSLSDSGVHSEPVTSCRGDELACAAAPAPGVVADTPRVSNLNSLGDASTVHRLRLAPEGHSFASASDPEQDVTEILALVGGESPNRGALDGFDFERVWFQAQWLPRRIAAEFERTGKPVLKPTALFMTAVRKDLPIQTDWPEYDFDRHNPEALSSADVDEYVRLFRADKAKQIPPELLDVVRELVTAQVMSEVGSDEDLAF